MARGDSRSTLPRAFGFLGFWIEECGKSSRLYPLAQLEWAQRQVHAPSERQHIGRYAAMTAGDRQAQREAGNVGAGQKRNQIVAEVRRGIARSELSAAAQRDAV
jgi:hypothetical protein